MTPPNDRSQSPEDELRRLPQTFCEAWASHDGHALAAMMAEDVDFVTVGATWLHGRDDFETYHARLFSGRFKGSTNTPLETAVRFLRPDLAVVRWSWTIKGDHDPDGSPRPQRFGLMTMIAEWRKGGWLVVAAHNTNGIAGVPREAEGIELPIVVPPSPR
jgi:uncharacterized protein (TIGR02246 family)